jgi:predicted TIM-barrel fold metal-dependent hydrolase
MDNVRRQMDAPDFQAIMAAIQALNFPMTFEEHFEVTCEFVRRYPDVTLIIPHMGMLNGGQERVQAQFRDNPKIHFDTSLGQVNETIVETLGASRLLYGCDYPYGSPADNLRRVQRLKIPEEEKELMLAENVKRLVRA